MAGYPLVVDLSGRRVVVVGAGRVGLRKLHDLLDAGADDVRVVSPTAAVALPAAPRVHYIARKFVVEDLAGAWLVIASTDDAAVNEQIVAECQRQRIWCIASGALPPEFTHSPARTPAHRRGGELLVAVSAGGTPGLASHIVDKAWQAVGDRVAFVAAVSRRRQTLKHDTTDAELRRVVMSYLASDRAAADFAHGGQTALDAVVGGMLSGELPVAGRPMVSVTLDASATTAPAVGDRT